MRYTIKRIRQEGLQVFMVMEDSVAMAYCEHKRDAERIVEALEAHELPGECELCGQKIASGTICTDCQHDIAQRGA